MVKIFKYVNSILIATLIILSTKSFDSKKVMLDNHHYQCSTELKASNDEINYRYYYDIYTDGAYMINTNQLIVEFSYKNKRHYQDSKKVYISNSEYDTKYDDKKFIISLIYEVDLANDEKQYFDFIEKKMSDSYTCEEVL